MHCLTGDNINEQINTISHELKKESVSHLEVGIYIPVFKLFYKTLYRLLFIKEYATHNNFGTLDIHILDHIQGTVVNGTDLSAFEIPSTPELIVIPEADLRYKCLDHIALGGTFDHTHSGHILLLYSAAYLAKNELTCGLVEFPKKNQQQIIESLASRSENIHEMLKNKVLNVNVVPLNDPYGPTTIDASISGLVASTETKDNALKINEIRIKKGLQSLQIILVDTLPDLLHGGKLSSSKIREDLAAKR